MAEHGSGVAESVGHSAGWLVEERNNIACNVMCNMKYVIIAGMSCVVVSVRMPALRTILV